MSSPEPVIGIDLGTTNSCVSVVIDGEVHVVPDESGSPLQSSVVAFLGDGSVVVGNQAKHEAITDPLNTVFSAKRLIGRSFDSSQVQRAVRTLPYQVARGKDLQPFIEIRGEKYGLPEVSGIVLRRMKDIAGSYLGQGVEQAVIFL